MVLASGAIVGIFLLVQLGALALVEPFQEEGHQVVEDTSDPSISVAYLLAILVMTALMLAAIKYGGASLLRLLIIFAGAYISFFVLQILVPSGVNPTVDGTSADVFAGGGALAIGLALYLYPEWYVIDAAGILMGIGAAGLFGVNFGILPAVVLLTVLAVYDAISVYGTEHMLTLAEGVMEMRVPVVLVVPLSLSYSFLDSDPPESLQEGDDTAGGSADNTAGESADDERDDTTSDDRPALTAQRLETLDRAAEADERDLRELETHDLFGVLSILGDFRRLETAETITEARVLGFFRPDFKNVMRRNPKAGAEIAMALARHVATQHVEAIRLVEEQDGRDVALNIYAEAAARLDTEEALFSSRAST